MSSNFKTLVNGIPTDLSNIYVQTIVFTRPRLFAVGGNSNGQLGDGTITTTTAFAELPNTVGDVGWKKISAGLQISAGIRSDGTMWTWGPNFSYHLGDGTTTSKSSPVMISGIGGWRDVVMYNSTQLALREDGTIWSWGDDSYGDTGHGTTSGMYSIPTQIGTSTNWTQIAVGQKLFACINSKYELWMWGSRTDYPAMSPATALFSSPVQVGSLTNWKQISIGRTFVGAIKTDGTLWTWGDNTSGQLGNGTLISTSSPIQVGSLTDWKSVVCGHSAWYAIKTNGTLWSCGLNGIGQLGDGTIIPKSSPIQVGSLTTWKNVSTFSGYHQAANNTVFAQQTDGTWWAWGSNNGGIFGSTSYGTSTSSPVQLSSSLWTSISSGHDHTLGIYLTDFI